jgi:hypothetical protein
MKQFLTIGLWLMAVTLVAPAQAQTQADKIYRWIDDEGVTHYTAHPPRGRNSTQIRSRTGHSEPVNYGTPGAGDQAAGPTTPQVEAVESARDQERCAAARQNLETLQSMARIRVMGEDGEYRYLDDEERQQRALDSQRVVDETC